VVSAPVPDLFEVFSLRPVGRCLCSRATICVYTSDGAPNPYMHMPDEYVALTAESKPEPYCFWWSSFKLLRRVLSLLDYWFFEHFRRPILRLFKAKDFKYTCHFCGRKTRQPPTKMRGVKSVSYCSSLDCIEQLAEWSVKEGREEEQA
jgi:hypothetical protein